MDTVFTLIKTNAWQIIVAILLIFVIMLAIHHGIKYFLSLIVLTVLGFYIYQPSLFVIDLESKKAEEKILDQQAINTLVANKVNVRYLEGKNGSFTITTNDSVIYGTYISSIVTIIANGREVEIQKTPQIEEFITYWRNEDARIKKAAGVK